MGHRRAGKCPTASFSALVIAGGVGGATGGASAAGVGARLEVPWSAFTPRRSTNSGSPYVRWR